MKVKGPYRGQSRLASMIPMNFDYMPARVGRQKFKPKPRLLRDLMDLKRRLSDGPRDPRNF